MKPLLMLLLPLFFISCNNSKARFNVDDQYVSNMEQFKVKLSENRVNFLELVGLVKLEASESTIGSDSINNIVFDIEGLAPIIGKIKQVDSTLKFIAEEGVVIKTEANENITELILDLDEFGSSVRLYHEDLNWQVITRSGQHYLRVWYTNNPAVKAFEGFERFEINPELIFKGKFTYYENAKSEIVKSEVDGQRNTKFIGYVSFEYQGEAHKLEVGGNGFTMVSDETTGEETYGGGRYIYLDLPSTSGPVSLDFNYLYNPPCAFSKFTTCLYPPRQNYLPYKITAGEQMVFIGNYRQAH